MSAPNHAFTFNLAFKLNTSAPSEQLFLEALWAAGCTDCTGGPGGADELTLLFFRRAPTEAIAIEGAAHQVVFALLEAQLAHWLARGDVIEFEVRLMLETLWRGRYVISSDDWLWTRSQ
jgi:hypothetical protein